MKCAVCQTEGNTRFGLPFGWFTLKDPGEILVCSVRCMDAVFDELNVEAAKAASAWKAGL